MRKNMILVVAALAIQGCATSQPVADSSVRIVTADEKSAYNCQFIQSVSGFDEYNGNPAIESERATAQAQAEAAELGANAIHIVFTDSNINGSSVSGEALNCNFPD